MIYHVFNARFNQTDQGAFSLELEMRHSLTLARFDLLFVGVRDEPFFDIGTL